MAAQLFYMPFLPVPSQRGLPSGAARAYFYVTGTTTLAPAYADAGLTTPLENPVVADALGRLPDIYLDESIVYRVRVLDAKGAQLGSDVDPYYPGQAVTITPNLPQLIASDGSSKVGFTYGSGSPNFTAQDVLQGAVITPQLRKLQGYATRDAAAAATADNTAVLQELVNLAAALGRPFSGNGLWYRATNIDWPSNTNARDLNIFQIGGSVDASPFNVSSKNNITFTDCRVDGNRLNQTNLTSSGGDGQRSGFKIYGRCDNIRLIRPVAEYCATEGIHCWIGTTIPASGTDYLQTRVYIEEPRCNWNGRHGISTASQRGFRLVGGSARDNGKDLPGVTGPYTNGGYGRTANGQLGGPKYGRGLTAESYLPGEGYNGWEVDGFDGRGNIGGLLIYHRVWAGQTEACFDTMVRNCKFDDPFGGNGDGSGVIFAINNATNAAYTGSDAFSGLRLLNNTWGRNYVNINSATDIVVEAGSAIITTGSYSVIFTNCANVVKCDLPSNKPVLGRPSPITNVSITTTSGWTIGSSPVLSVPSDRAGGRLTYRFAFNVTPTGAGQALFRLAFTPGFVLTPARPNAQNTVTGLIVDATAFPGSNGSNEIDVYVMANGTNLSVIALDFEAERLP